jgi:hypothetical protein
MTRHDDEHQDLRDPLRTAFDDYQRAPRDVVPRTVEHTLDDLRLLADGGALVTVTHYELGADGITRHSERVTVAAPFIQSDEEKR